MRITPLSLAVRKALEARDLTITEVAAQLKMERATLNARLIKQNPLEMDSPKDLELVRRIAKVIDMDEQEIMDAAMKIAREGANAPQAADINIVNVLLGTLRDGSAPDDRKDAAEAAIRRMLGVE